MLRYQFCIRKMIQMKLMHLKTNNTILQNWKQKSSSRKIQFSTHTVSFSLYHLLQHCSCLNFSMLFIIDRDEMDPIQWGLSLYFYLNRRIFLLVVVVDEKFCSLYKYRICFFHSLSSVGYNYTCI